MRLLVYTTLFPNREQPHFGVFVKERLARFRERYDVPMTVVAPVPLAPPAGPRRWTHWRAVPEQDVIDGFQVFYPRYLSPPGFGDRWRAALMAAGSRACLLEQARALSPTVLDSHYAYPDGVAAFRLRPVLSAALGRPLPLVITARGTDLNLMPGQPAVRRQLRLALQGCEHVVCVAEALRTVALSLGAPSARVSTLRNGVDVTRFTPGDRRAARERLHLPVTGRLLLCVGHLIERKGQHLLLEAYAQAYRGEPDPPLLMMVGEGESRARLQAQARTLGIEARVRFAGAVKPEELPHYYRAADALVLASLREGWPNVVLEALACGTPVLATRVWGTPEILDGCAAGLLVDATVKGLREGLQRLSSLDVSAARPWAERHTWDSTVQRMHEIFESVAAR